MSLLSQLNAAANQQVWLPEGEVKPKPRRKGPRVPGHKGPKADTIALWKAIWKAKRAAKWHLIFAALGYDNITTTRIANHMGRSNSMILKDLRQLQDDGLVAKPKRTKGLGQGPQRLLWSWTGDRHEAE